MNDRAIELANEMVSRLEAGATKQAFQSVAELSIEFCESIPVDVKRGSIPFLIYQVRRGTVAEPHAEFWAEILRANPTRAYIADQAKRLQSYVAESWQYYFTDPFRIGTQCETGVLWFNEIVGRKNVTMTDHTGVQSVVEQCQVSERMYNLTENQTKAVAILNQWIRFLRGDVKENVGETIRRAALRAVVDGGLSGVLNQADSCSAVDKASATMSDMLKKDSGYYDWTVDQWASHLCRGKKTIIKTAAWKQVLGWRNDNKKSVKVSDPSFKEN